MSDDKIKARLYIDGNFTFHITEYLAKFYKKNIDWNNFLDFITDTISKAEKNKRCTLDSHFFVGTKLITNNDKRDYLYNSMEHAQITKHSTPLKTKKNGGLKEDGVDTNLVFHATKDYYEKEAYDYLVLMAGDSDFWPLVKGLSKDGVKTLIIYIHFEDKELGTTTASDELLDIADSTINIAELVKKRSAKAIFTDITDLPEVEEKAPAAKLPVSLVRNEKTEKVEKSDNEKSEICFTKEDLVNAIKKTQDYFCQGKNDLVLISQAGEKLFDITGVRQHGKLIKIIQNNFPDDFILDHSQTDSPKIKIK